MFKNIKNKNGFSLMELLVVIGLMVILTSATIASIHFNKHQKVRVLTESVASDIRLVRNMVTSRVKDPFFGGQYPPGGYGMFVQTAEYGEQGYYIIFGESGATAGYQSDEDHMIKTVTIEESGFRIIDKNTTVDTVWSFYFTFIDEHNSVDNMAFHPGSKYLVMVADAGNNHLYHGYAGTIVIGELDEQGYTWSNLGTTYGPYQAKKPCPPTDPDCPGGQDTPIDEF